MDPQAISKITDILEQEAGIYDDILKISGNKTDVIISGKINDLDSMVKVEQKLITQLVQLENEREKIAGIISAEVGAKPGDISISDLIKYADEDYREKLSRCKDRLSVLLENIKKTNELNGKLIKNSLEYINFSINLFASVDTRSNNYGSSGALNGAKKRSLFDIKL